MSVTSCITKHFGASSPIAAYRADMAGDVADLVADGVTSEAAWLQVVDAKLADLRAERSRIEQVVAEAYAKTAAGKPAPQANATAGPKPPATVMGSRLLGLVNEKLRGLDPALLSEFSERIETRRMGRDGRRITQWRNPMTGLGLLFRRGGAQHYQEIAELLEGHGFIEPGAVEADATDAGERARELIRGALRKQETPTIDQQLAQAQAGQDAERDAYYAELDAQSAAEAESERAAIMDESAITAEGMDALTDDDIEFDFTPQEASNASRGQDQGTTAPGDAGEAGQDAGQAARAPVEAGEAAPGAAEEGLTAPTPEALQSAEDRAAAATKADAAEQKRLSDKAKADAERGEFALTGSSRPADVAAAAGQGDLLAPAAPDDRDHFTLKRGTANNTLEDVTFERGEYVSVHLVGSNKMTFGEIDGISHARREFSVDGLWHPFGAAYKAERPVAVPKGNAEPLSKAVERANKKFGAGLTDADKVGGTEEKLPEGTFADPSLPVNTGANARMVVIDKGEDAAGNEATFSRGEDSPTSPADLRSALEAEFGADTIAALEQAGLLTIGGKPGAALPADVAGVTDNGRIGLFAANTPTGSTAVAYHEALHATLRASIGDAAFDALMARMPALAADNKTFFAEAAERVPADTPAAVRNQELASYAVEQYQHARESMPAGVRQWVQDFIAALRAGLARALQAAGVGLKLRTQLLGNAAVLHRLARDGLHAMAREARQDRLGAQDMAPVFSTPAEANAWRAISQNDDLFALKKSRKDTIEAIAREIDADIKVEAHLAEGLDRYTLSLDGKTAELFVREPSAYGPHAYSMAKDQDGELLPPVTVRPGEQRWDERVIDDVWVNVSNMTPGKGFGAKVYAIAGDFAHNTGRVFIGDPAGVTDDAMRRRPEQMLSSALRWGTTEHLAPHPDQVQGKASIGVGPLAWEWGDDLGNIRRLIDVSLSALENAMPSSRKLDFDVNTGQFINAENGRPVQRVSVDRSVDRSWASGMAAGANAGRKTIARAAIWRSLLRESGSESVGRDGRRDGLLARLAKLAADRPQAVEHLFSRAGDAAGTLRSINQQKVRNTFADLIGNAGAKVSWWDKHLGTQYAKAEKFPAFKRVFERVQSYIEDVSTLANEAADTAPAILPKLETWKDLKQSFKQYGLSKADAEALGKPIFQGTLTDKKVYSDAELRRDFGLSAAQITNYRQFYAAVNTSLDQVVAADVLKLLGDKNPALRELALADRGEMRAGIEEYLTLQIGQADGAEKDRLSNLREDIRSKYERIDNLKQEGYAPLMRFGQYKVFIADAQGESLFFGLYETKAAANRMARELADDPEFKGLTIEQGVLSQEQYKLFNSLPVESLEMFAEAIGAEQSEVFQAYLRLAKNNRSAMKRLIHRKGTAGFSEDVPRVLASFVTSNARLAAAAMNLAGAKAEIENIRDGDVKDDAIALVESVQNPVETAAAARALMFMNFIGGSIASAVVNLTQPITMTLPYLSQFGGLAKASARLMAAGKMVASGKVSDPEMKAALKRAENDGTVSPQEIHHLQAQAMGAWGNNALSKQAAFIWGAPFSLAEQFNRSVSFIAAYQTAQAEGIEDPFAFAEKAVTETQGLYNSGNKPNLARNAIGAAALQFKQFSIHYLEWMTRMWNAGEPGSDERRAGRRAVLIALALLMVAAGSDGLPFAADLDDLIDTIGQAIGYNTNAKKTRRDFVATTLGLGDETADVFGRGLSALPGIPMDVSLRMSMGNLVPASGILLRSNTDRSRDLLEIAGPAGGLAKQYLDATQKMLGGDLAGGAKGFLPVAAQNAIKAMEMWSTGEARDTKGNKVMATDEVDGLMKFMGFSPAAIARESEKMGMARRSEQLAKNVEGEIAAKWARGFADRDAEAVKDARQELADWNRDNPSDRITITSAQIVQRVKKMRQSREQRFITSAAPERRAGVREAIQ